MVLEELDKYMQKNEARQPTYTVHQNKLKIDKRLKYKSFDTIKVLVENIGSKISISHMAIFFPIYLLGQGHKEKK